LLVAVLWGLSGSLEGITECVRMLSRLWMGSVGKVGGRDVVWFGLLVVDIGRMERGVLDDGPCDGPDC
jgi:hypothetical protein